VNRCFSDSEGGAQGIDSRSRESSDCLRSDMPAVQAQAAAARLSVADLMRLLYVGYPIEAHCAFCCEFWTVSLRKRVELGEVVAAACGTCVVTHTTTVDDGHRLRAARPGSRHLPRPPPPQCEQRICSASSLGACPPADRGVRALRAPLFAGAPHLQVIWTRKCPSASFSFLMCAALPCSESSAWIVRASMR
jgi:hypothetical protein